MKTLRYSPTMVDVSIVNETSPEANWNRKTGRQTDRQADRQTGRQTDRQANLCREAAPPKIKTNQYKFFKNHSNWLILFPDGYN